MTIRHVCLYMVSTMVQWESNRLTKTDVEAAGESIDGMAESTSKLRAQIAALTNVTGEGGVDILKDPDTYKETYTILDEIARVWKEMDQIDQAALLELMAGKNRAQGLAALLDSWDIAKKALNTAMNESEGSALRENDAYMRSIEAHLNVLTNKWNELWHSVANREQLNPIIDMGSHILDVVNDVGLLRAGLSSILPLLASINSYANNKGLFAVNASGKGIGIGSTITGLKAILTGQAKTDLNLDIINEYNKAVADGTLNMESFIAAQTDMNETTRQMLATANGKAIDLSNLGSSIQGVALKTKIATIGVKAFTAALNAVTVFAAIKAITFAIDKINEWIVTAEEANEAWQEAQAEYDSITASLESANQELKSNKERYEELLKATEGRTPTYVEQAEIDKLEATNEKLRENIELTKLQQQAAAIDTAESAVEAFNKNYSAWDQYDYDRVQGTVGLMGLDDIDTPSVLAAYYQYLLDLREEYNQQLKDAINSGDADQAKQIEGWLATIEQDIAKASGRMSEDIESWNTTISNIDAVPMQFLDDEMKTTRDNAAELIDIFTRLLYTDTEWNKMKLDDLWDLDGMEETKQKLIELAQSGKLDESTLDSFDGLSDKIDRLNLRVEDGTSQAQGFINEIYRLADAMDSVKPYNGPELLPTVRDASGVYSEQTDRWDALNALREEVRTKGTGNITPAAVNALAEAFKDLTDVDIDSFLKIIGDSDTTALEAEGAFNSLANQLIDSSGCLKQVSEETADMTIAFLKSQGITNAEELVLAQLGDTATKVAATMSSLTRSTTEQVQALNNMGSNWDALNTLYDTFKAEDFKGFTATDLSGVVEAFSEVAGVDVESFVDVLSDSGSTAEDVQNAFDKLATEYVYASGCLDGLTEETADLTIAELKNQGIVNASEVVTRALAASKEYAAATGRELASATNDEIIAFLNEKDAAQDTKGMVAEYALQKQIANGTTLTTDGDIANLAALVQACGGSIKAIQALQKARKQAQEDAVKSFAPDQIMSSPTNGIVNSAMELKKKTNAAKKEYDQKIEELNDQYYDDIMKEVNAALNTVTGAGVAGNYGGSTANSKNSSGSGSDKSEQEQEFDWVQRRLDLLDKAHDKQLALSQEESESYYDRIYALEQLIAYDKERMEFNEVAAQKYQEAWLEAASKIPKEYKELIEQGGPIPMDKLSGDMATNVQAAMDAYDKVQEQEEKAEEDAKEALEHQKEALKLREEEIKAQQEQLQSEIDLIDAKRELAEATGQVITEGMYQDQIKLSKRLSSAYEDQIDNLQEQLDLAEYGSAEYYSIQASIADCEAAIIDCKTQQAEWNEAIKRLPIERLQKYLDTLEDIKQDLQNFLDIQSGVGLQPTPEQLQQMIDLSDTEITKLLEQQGKLKDLLKDYQYGSEKFSDTQDEIQGIDDQIASLIQEQEEWNEQILQFPVQQLERDLEVLSHARSDLDNYMAEQEAMGRTATVDQYQQLNAIAQQQLSMLETERQMLTQLLGVYDKDSDRYAETVDQLQSVEDSISGIVQEQAQWNEAILNLPVEKVTDINDELSMYSDVLQGVLDDYDSALAGVNALLQQHVDLLEDAKEATEKEYEEKIKPLQDELDLLEKTNEARQVQLNIEQAQYNLDRAKEQKTNQVVRNGEVVYEADMDAIRSANQEMADALYEKQRHDLQTQIDALEEQRDQLIEEYDNEIERLNDISDRWSEIVDKIQQAVDIQKAGEILGAGWDASILSGNDDALYNMFKQLYELTFNEKDQTDKQIASNERVASMMQEMIDDYRSGSITYEQALSGILRLARDMQGGYTSLEQLTGMMDKDGIKNLTDIADFTNQSLEDAVSELAKYLGIVQSNTDSVDDYTSTWSEMQGNIQGQIEALKAAATSLQTFEEYLDVFRTNSESIAKFTSSWDEMKQNIADQVKALEEAAKALEELAKQKAASHSSSGSSGGGGGGRDYYYETYTGYAPDKYDPSWGPGYQQPGESFEDMNARWNAEHPDNPVVGHEYRRKVYYHSGLEKGTVGTEDKQVAEKIRKLGLVDLKPDEFPAVLKKGELVATAGQQKQMLQNFQKAMMVGGNVAGVAPVKQANNFTFTMGDIVLPDVTNPHEFADALGAQFQPLLRQAMSKIV